MIRKNIPLVVTTAVATIFLQWLYRVLLAGVVNIPIPVAILMMVFGFLCGVVVALWIISNHFSILSTYAQDWLINQFSFVNRSSSEWFWHIRTKMDESDQRIVGWLKEHQAKSLHEEKLEELKDLAVEGAAVLIQKPFLERGAIGPGTCLGCLRQHEAGLNFDATQIDMFDKAIHRDDCVMPFMDALIKRIRQIESELDVDTVASTLKASEPVHHVKLH